MSCATGTSGSPILAAWKGKFPVMVIAHRGFSGRAPENTMAAFKRAMDIGSDAIEFDVRFSRDGRLIVFHDDTLERTTNGKGRVADDGKVIPMEVKAGDRVLFSKYAGTEVKIAGEEHLIMREEDILGIIEK